jgi:hypothetical protein
LALPKDGMVLSKDTKDPAVFPKKGTLTIKDMCWLWQNTSFLSLVSFQSSKDQNIFAKLRKTYPTFS